MPTPLDSTPCNFFIPLGASSGPMEFNVCISDVGRVTDFTWGGNSQLFPFDSTYIVCDPTNNYFGYNAFNQVSFSEPGGTGTLPLTVIAATSDGQWQVKHLFTSNNKELELTDTVTIKRLGGPIGPSPTYFAQVDDTMLGGDDLNDTGISSHDTVAGTDAVSLDGLNMMAISRTVPHTTGVDFWSSNFACNTTGGGNPYGPNDMGWNITYNVGAFNTGQSKTVKFKWGKQ
jgi:hypothetical protein